MQSNQINNLIDLCCENEEKYKLKPFDCLRLISVDIQSQFNIVHVSIYFRLHHMMKKEIYEFIYVFFVRNAFFKSPFLMLLTCSVFSLLMESRYYTSCIIILLIFFFKFFFLFQLEEIKELTSKSRSISKYTQS